MELSIITAIFQDLHYWHYCLFGLRTRSLRIQNKTGDWRLETGNWRRKGKRPRLLHSVHANTQTFRQSQEKRQTDTCPTTPCRSRAFGIIKKNKRQRGENKEGAQELEPERESDNPTIRQSVRNQSGSRQPNFRSSTEICKCRTLLYGVVASFSFPGTAIPKEETLRRTKARHRLPWLLVHPLTITTSYSTESIRSLTRSLWVLPVNLLLADRRTGGNLSFFVYPKPFFFPSQLGLFICGSPPRTGHSDTHGHTETTLACATTLPRLYHDSPTLHFRSAPFSKAGNTDSPPCSGLAYFDDENRDARTHARD